MSSSSNAWQESACSSVLREPALSAKVASTICREMPCLAVAGRPPRGRSFSIPASRLSAKRVRHRETFFERVFSSVTMSLFIRPAAAKITILAAAQDEPVYYGRATNGPELLVFRRSE